MYKAMPTLLSSSSPKVTGILGFVLGGRRGGFFLMFFPSHLGSSNVSKLDDDGVLPSDMTPSE